MEGLICIQPAFDKRGFIVRKKFLGDITLNGNSVEIRIFRKDDWPSHVHMIYLGSLTIHHDGFYFLARIKGKIYTVYFMEKK